MERLIVIITWFCLGTILLITWLGLLQTGYILQTCSSTTTAVNLPQSKFTVTTETVQTTDKVTVRKKIAHEKYGLRQLFVDNFCNKYIGSDEKVTAYNLDHGGPMDWTRHLYYDYNHGMMFCPINKVGSSTWFDHFLRSVLLSTYFVKNRRCPKPHQVQSVQHTWAPDLSKKKKKNLKTLCHQFVKLLTLFAPFE